MRVLQSIMESFEELKRGYLTENGPFCGCFVVETDSVIEVGEDNRNDLELRHCKPGLWRGVFEYLQDEEKTPDVQTLGVLHVCSGETSELLDMIRTGEANTDQTLRRCSKERLGQLKDIKYVLSLPWEKSPKSLGAGENGVYIRSNYIKSQQFQDYLYGADSGASTEDKGWEDMIDGQYDGFDAHGGDDAHRLGGVVGFAESREYEASILKDDQGVVIGVLVGGDREEHSDE